MADLGVCVLASTLVAMWGVRSALWFLLAEVVSSSVVGPFPGSHHLLHGRTGGSKRWPERLVTVAPALPEGAPLCLGISGPETCVGDAGKERTWGSREMLVSRTLAAGLEAQPERLLSRPRRGTDLLNPTPYTSVNFVIMFQAPERITG